MIVTTTFQRKTFRVHAIRITEENMQELSEWCGGTIYKEGDTRGGFKVYIHVPVGTIHNTKTVVKKIRAYLGDWITTISDNNNFMVYSNKTFMQAFEEIRSTVEKREVVSSILEEYTKRLQDVTLYGSNDPTEETIQKIMELV